MGFCCSEKSKKLLCSMTAFLTLLVLIFVYEEHRRRTALNNVFHFSTLSKEDIEGVKKNYMKQKIEMREIPILEDLERVRQSNADPKREDGPARERRSVLSPRLSPEPLPPRLYGNLSAEQLCQSKSSRCIPRFISMGTLIATSPNHRLATCLVQKNMSTLMMNIICYLLREKEFISMGRIILKEKWETSFCEHKNSFSTVDSMLQYLQVANLSEWSLTMVTREPTDRFLSGFIDRCLRVGKECYGCGSNMTCFLQQTYFRAGSYAMRMLAKDDDMIKPTTTKVDRHLFPQNWRCNLNKYYGSYEFIRYSTFANSELLEDLIHVLRSRKVSESSINYIAKSLRSGRTAHSTVTSQARMMLEDRLRTSPYLMELIVRIFYHDFKLFGYPLPDLNSIQSSYFKHDSVN